jgi:hypothetical protein
MLELGQGSPQPDPTDDETASHHRLHLSRRLEESTPGGVAVRSSELHRHVG